MPYSPKSIKSKTTQKLFSYIICLLKRAEAAGAIQTLFVLASLWHSGQGHHIKRQHLRRRKGNQSHTLVYTS